MGQASFPTGGTDGERSLLSLLSLRAPGISTTSIQPNVRVPPPGGGKCASTAYRRGDMRSYSSSAGTASTAWPTTRSMIWERVASRLYEGTMGTPCCRARDFT